MIAARLLDRTIADTLAAELTDDSDTVELGNRRYRLRVEPDETLRVEDIAGDNYGALQWADTRRDDGYHQRPDSFTGNAELLGIGRSYDRIWWEPPTDVPRTSEHFAALKRGLVNLLEYGYSVVGLEVSELVTDSRGGEHWVVLDTAWLGGIEPFPDNGWVAEIVRDLYAELG